MATPTAQSASQVITDSLLEINVIRPGQALTADQQDQAIRRLNQMMAMWEGDGIRLGYIPIGAVTEILTIPDASVLGVMASLSIHMAPAFGATVSQELIAKAERGMAVIDKLTCAEVLATTELQPSAALGTSFNIAMG